MGSATGMIYGLEGGKPLAFFRYSGTSDYAVSHLFESSNALWDTFVTGKGFPNFEWIECTCGKLPKDCYLYTQYGNGFYWRSAWCPDCRAITGITHPYYMKEDCKKFWCDCEEHKLIDGLPPEALTEDKGLI